MKNRTPSAMLVILMLLTCLFSGLPPAAALADSQPSASAPLWLTELPDPDAVRVVTEDAAQQSADSVGKVVNGSSAAPTNDQLIDYSYTPIDVVLVIDHSGSMEATGGSDHNLLYYAVTAAWNFAEILYDINPASMIAVVEYDHTVSTRIGLTGHNGSEAVHSSLNGISLGGRTNIGDAFLQADAILDASSSGHPQAVLLLTDGIANEGGYDPVRYAVDCGSMTAGGRMVFTFGLVGGMTASDKKYTRSTLDAGYATRYFEIDFDDVDNVSLQIYRDFTKALAIMEANTSSDPDQSLTVLTVYGDVEVQVSDGKGGFLSTEEKFDSYDSPLGSFSRREDGCQFILNDSTGEDYTISLHGTGWGVGGYSIERIRSSDLGEEEPFENLFFNYPGHSEVITSSENGFESSVIPFNLMDQNATDPFTGEPANGTDYLSIAKLAKSANVTTMPDGKGEKLCRLNRNDTVYAIAIDPETTSVLISFTLEQMQCCGWIPLSALEIYGYIPEWVEPLNLSCSVADQAETYRAPDERSLQAEPLSAGDEFTVLFSQEDPKGQEWLYVEAKHKKNSSWVYLPAHAVRGWKRMARNGFGLGKRTTVILEELCFQPVTIPGDQKLTVWTAPVKGAYRGGGEKHNAYLGTKGGLETMGWVNNNWLMVCYGKSKGGYRVGFIPREEIKESTIPLAIPPVCCGSEKATVKVPCDITDDPYTASETLGTLPAGEQVTVLFRVNLGGYPCAYVETRLGNKPCNGFVFLDCLQFL